MAMPQYPEHDKLHNVQSKSQAIGDFLTWLLDDQKALIAESHEHSEGCYDCGKQICETSKGQLVPMFISVKAWLAQYFDVDEQKLEEEKRLMLDELRSKASTG
jgi:hypothetical protein